VAEALSRAGVKVRVHRDCFSPGTPDEIWLAQVGRNGWAVLTKDTRIRYRETEKSALLEAKVPAFVLTGKALDGEQMAAAFVAALPKIERYIEQFAPPFIARVTRSGNIDWIHRPRNSRKGKH